MMRAPMWVPMWVPMRAPRPTRAPRPVPPCAPARCSEARVNPLACCPSGRLAAPRSAFVAQAPRGGANDRVATIASQIYAEPVPCFNPHQQTLCRHTHALHPLVSASMEARTLALTPLANITMPSPSAPPPPPAPPRMPSGQRESIAAGASVGLVVLLCFLTCFICRVWRRNRYYSKVQRTLDDEERAFQECALALATQAFFRNHRGLHPIAQRPPPPPRRTPATQHAK